MSRWRQQAPPTAGHGTPRRYGSRTCHMRRHRFEEFGAALWAVQLNGLVVAGAAVQSSGGCSLQIRRECATNISRPPLAAAAKGHSDAGVHNASAVPGSSRAKKAVQRWLSLPDPRSSSEEATSRDSYHIGSSCAITSSLALLGRLRLLGGS
jgi:hypothetical protein